MTDTKSAKNHGVRKTRIGRVVSDAMDKTIVVEFVARVPHPKFGKIVKHTKKFYAHDENNEAKVGDTVRIIETRPLSKLKRWRLVEIQSHDPGAVLPDLDHSADLPSDTSQSDSPTTSDTTIKPDAI